MATHTEIFPVDATYLDGSAVREGDSIRYRQAAGGLMARSEEWRYGTAKPFPHTDAERESSRIAGERWGYVRNLDVLCLFDGQRYFNISGHEVEKV